MLNNNTKRRQALATLTVAVMLVALMAVLVGAQPAQAQGNTNPGVLPPDQKWYGLTYGEWSAKWYQWIYAIPAPNNPWLDTTGQHAKVGQNERVFFLAGVVCGLSSPQSMCTGEGATVTRDVTIRQGMPLFFPVANFQLDNLGNTGTPLTSADLQALAAQYMEKVVVRMSAQIDGVDVQNLANYRVTAPVFSYRIPGNNIYQAQGLDFGPQKVDPAVSDGVFLLLAPLPVGQHTIHFIAVFATDNKDPHESFFTLDVTYNITVK